MSDDRNIALEMKQTVVKPQGTPILVKKENKIKLYQGERIIKNLKFGPASSLYQEDVIFESTPGNLIRDSPVKITITNRFDLLKNSTHTIVTYYDQLNGNILSEKTSDQMVKFIGQSNYEAVIAALLTVVDEEVRVKAIMSLLTTTAAVKEKSTQTTHSEDFPEDKIKTEPSKTVEVKSCQTEENCMDLIYKFKQRRRVKRNVLTPYPIKDTAPKIIKRIIVNPTKPHHQPVKEQTNKKQHNLVIKTEDSTANVVTSEGLDKLPVITDMMLSDDNSNDSNLTLSDSLISESALRRAEINIGKHTTNESATVTVFDSQKHFITLPNGEVLTVLVKPEYPYHMATPEILRSLNDEDKKRLVGFQLYLDFKLCLTKSPEGYLPIHYAVLNNDVDLLKRQCVVLKYRQQSLDITYENLTPLQLSISQDTPQCTALLLQQGADPLLTDDEQRTCLHLASESSSDHLKAVINHCENNAKEILQDNELWKEEYEGKSKKILAAILLKHLCEMSDDQGYTPLMGAAKSGNYMAVMKLIEASPDCINLQMPNCGNTALFLAVEGACFDASNRGNKSKVADHFNRTISILLENHADITKANHSGITINDLLTDNSNSELSMIFANKITSRFFDGHLPGGAQFDNYMLIKNKEGNVDITELKKSAAHSESPKPTKARVVRNKTAPTVNNDVRKTEIDNLRCKSPNQIKRQVIIQVAENKSHIVKCEPTVVTIKRTRKPIKKDKPIILENISIAQSKPVLDLNSVNTQNVQFISPNDKLIKVTSTNSTTKRRILKDSGPSEKKVKGLET